MPIEHTIVDLFEATVDDDRARTAIEDPTRRVTYGELDGWANGVARVLRKPQQSERVGVVLDHDAATAAGILGVLKAGSTAVPLDIRSDNPRLSAQLRDSDVGACISRAKDAERLQELAGRRLDVIDIDAVTSDYDRPRLSVDPGDLAFIIYTSGSTGEPKGVMRPHRSYAHLRGKGAGCLMKADRVTILNYAHTALGLASLCLGLMSGATLCYWDIRVVGLPTPAWLRSRALTVFWCTPSIFREWAKTVQQTTELPDVRLLRLDGEAALPKDFEAFQRFCSRHAVFLHGYGSTETGSIVHHPITSQTRPTGDSLPLGRPVDDVELLLLDDASEVVADGASGEIVVSSRYMAVGYWRRPAETASRFRELPDGRQTFHTGDLGCRASDGGLVHLGRKDAQVKIYGVRVELGEIETAVASLGEVSSCAATVHTDASGDRHIVAYLVPVGPAATRLDLRALTRALREKLPVHMVPRAFVVLDAIPLNGSGKIDRQRLPPPTSFGAAVEEYVAPRNAMEERLCAIFAEVLRVPRVGIVDDFFDLGGHSLVAMRVVARVLDAFDVLLPVIAMFEAPTVEGIAERILEMELRALPIEIAAKLLE